MWGAYLPKYGDPPFHTVNATNGGGAVGVAGSTWEAGEEEELDDEEDDLEDDEANSTALEMRRNQVGSHFHWASENWTPKNLFHIVRIQMDGLIIRQSF